MPTFLFDKVIFGPVKSRRLGVSLGVNLLPTNKKICSFDCIYCECGLNTPGSGDQLPDRDTVRNALAASLIEMQQKNLKPDVITFAGNGEPTLHPHFSDIIDDTIALRNQYCPEARIAVLSNATRLEKSDVVNALKKVDDNILKLDSGLESTIRLIDRPSAKFSLQELTRQLKAFEGKLIIQTMFVRGSFNNQPIDNTTDADVRSWLELLTQIKPQKVMIYTIDRDTPVDSLKKVPLDELKQIASKAETLGFTVQVSG
jgi:wyosine [tRNA(Phe)-imidazoG37] synthetase (radical SAM superfamily)